MRPIFKFMSVAMIGLMPAVAQAADAPVTGAATAPVAAPAATASTFTDAQKTEIQGMIRDFLINKEPETIIKAAQEAQRRQEADSASKSQQAVSGNKDKLFNDKTSPVGGNPKGDVTIVEFFDYQCGYCKMAQTSVGKLLDSDKNIRFIYKEFPILGPDSVQATKAALASVAQGKYEKFHSALMSSKEHMSDDVIFKVAKDSGLDIDKLKKDMNGDDVKKTIEANIALGGEIGARGTPTFVVGEQVFPGAMQYEQMQQAVTDARAKAPK